MSLRTTADSELSHARFVKRVIAAEKVWACEGPNGVIPCPSNDAEDRDVLPFWSDEAYARREARNFETAKPLAIDLFDFLFRWLPGMQADGFLAGTNWTGDLVGKEIEPLELQDAILDQMTGELEECYLARLREELESPE